jgi:hypothetical protein
MSAPGQALFPNNQKSNVRFLVVGGFMAIRKILKKSPSAPKAREETKARQEMDEDRREVMRKLGVYGAYTAPALIALLKSGKAAANSFLGG